MLEKNFVILLILCSILSQAIIGSFLEAGDDISAKLLFRKKRLIDRTPSVINKKYSIAELHYILKLLHFAKHICTVILVSPEFVLTARICTGKPQRELFVESVNLAKNGDPQYHAVMKIFREGDLALLQIHPHITESPSGYRRIRLYDGIVGTRRLVTVAGWETIGGESKLRATDIPIYSQMGCTAYLDTIGYKITKNNFCTFNEERVKGCTHEDSGSALLSDAGLIGVLIFAGTDLPGPPMPDVFIRVNENNGYNHWIKLIIGKPSHPANYAELQYFPQEQTLHYATRPNNLFVHPHPAHFSHTPPSPTPRVIHV